VSRIRAGGELGDVLAPLGEDLLALVGIRPHSERRAEVIEHHGGLRHGTRQVSELSILMVVVPGVVAEAESAEHPHAPAEVLAGVEPLRGSAGNRERLRVRIARTRVPDAAEQTPSRRLVRAQDLLHCVAEREVGMRDDAGDHRPSRPPAGALFCDRSHELGLTEALKVLRSALAVARAALDEHRLLDAMPGAGVGPEILEQIAAPLRPVPQVMMRIDDRPLRLDHLFHHLLEPLRSTRHWTRHGFLPSVVRESESTASAARRRRL
jgi:hypothetical protein